MMELRELEAAIGPAASELTEKELALLRREAAWVASARERIRRALVDVDDPAWSIRGDRGA